MSADLELLEGVSLFLSKDDTNFEPIIELKRSALKLAFKKGDSILQIVSHLLGKINSITTEGTFNSYSIQLHIAGNTIYLSNTFIHAHQNKPVINISTGDFNENKNLYNSLTNREKQILCFLSRGYKQAIICFVLRIGIETFKTHRKSLYMKMDFKSKSELTIWSDKYLDLYFRLKV